MSAELVQLVREQQERIVALERRLAVAEAAPRQAEQSDDEWLTVAEAAAQLKVCDKTIYTAVKAGEIPGACKVGGSIRLLKSALLGWSTSGSQPAAAGKGRINRKTRRTQ